MGILVSRTVGENILLTKHTIKALPFYENDNSPTLDITRMDGNKQLRTLNSYPVGYDFICNIIDKIKSLGLEPNTGLIFEEPYYSAWISPETFADYLKGVSDHHKRLSLFRQLQKDLTSGFVMIRAGSDQKGRYIRSIPPFRIIDRNDREDGKVELRIAWSKAIFETLVTGDCTKQGNDGYIELPRYFYPLATQATKAAETINKITVPFTEGTMNRTELKGRTHLIGSSNPIYRIEILAKMKNTNKGKDIGVNRLELLQTVVPELVTNDGYLKIKEWELHDILQKEISEIFRKEPEAGLLKNFYLGDRKHNTSYLYF